MPTYQYVCTDCSTPLEVQQAFSDDPLVQCPTCAGRLRKVFSAVGVVFKGTGFYRNDSRGPDKADSDGVKAGKDSGQESGKESGKDSSKDSGKDSGSGDGAAKKSTGSDANSSAGSGSAKKAESAA